MGQLVDLTGKRFARLTVLRRVPNKLYGVPRWLCACDCGNETEGNSGSLKSGYKKSCGCMREEHDALMKTGIRFSHRMTRTLIYGIWIGMRDRCKNPKNKAFNRYGGRGIKVCERWDISFEAFRDDIGPRPSKNHSLDRIDNDGDYEPSNCRWSTRKEQCSNRRDNKYFELSGENLTISEWARRLGTSTDTINFRLKAGWPLEQALTHPVIRGLKRKGVYLAN